MRVNGTLQAGIAWFAVKPGTTAGSSTVARQGYVGVAANNVNYPALAVLPNGTGRDGVLARGSDYYPDSRLQALRTQRAGGGEDRAPADGHRRTGSRSTRPSPTPASRPRPRWGDYSAAVTDGSSIFMGTEYIESRCSFSQFRTDIDVRRDPGPADQLGHADLPGDAAAPVRPSTTLSAPCVGRRRPVRPTPLHSGTATRYGSASSFGRGSGHGSPRTPLTEGVAMPRLRGANLVKGLAVIGVVAAVASAFPGRRLPRRRGRPRQTHGAGPRPGIRPHTVSGITSRWSSSRTRRCPRSSATPRTRRI